jgi:hypothetical protein
MARWVPSSRLMMGTVISGVEQLLNTETPRRLKMGEQLARNSHLGGTIWDKIMTNHWKFWATPFSDKNLEVMLLSITKSVTQTPSNCFKKDRFMIGFGGCSTQATLYIYRILWDTMGYYGCPRNQNLGNGISPFRSESWRRSEWSREAEEYPRSRWLLAKRSHPSWAIRPRKDVGDKESLVLHSDSIKPTRKPPKKHFLTFSDQKWSEQHPQFEG